jgi:hypothetical protein
MFDNRLDAIILYCIKLSGIIPIIMISVIIISVIIMNFTIMSVIIMSGIKMSIMISVILPNAAKLSRFSNIFFKFSDLITDRRGYRSNKGPMP